MNDVMIFGFMVGGYAFLLWQIYDIKTELKELKEQLKTNNK